VLKIFGAAGSGSIPIEATLTLLGVPDAKTAFGSARELLKGSRSRPVMSAHRHRRLV